MLLYVVSSFKSKFLMGLFLLMFQRLNKSSLETKKNKKYLTILLNWDMQVFPKECYKRFKKYLFSKNFLCEDILHPAQGAGLNYNLKQPKKFP